MFKRAGIIALLALFTTLPLQAETVDVHGVKLPTQIEVGGEDLVLNGAGTRSLLMFRVYVGALYLPERAADAEAVLAMDGPKRVQMTLLRDIDRDTLANAMTGGFQKNLTEQERQRFQGQIQQFTEMLDGGKRGDTVFLDMLPGEGVRITHNGRVLGTVAGDDFQDAVLKLWLGPEPPDRSLQRGMLGD